MFTVINHIPVVAEHRDEFEARFRASLVNMEGVKGLIHTQVWRPAEGGSSSDERYPTEAYMVQTVWESEAAFKAWVGSPSFRASHREPMPDTWRAGPAMMTRHALAIDTTETDA